MSEGNEQSSSLRDALAEAYDKAAASTDDGKATSQDEVEAKPAHEGDSIQSTAVEAETPIDPPAHWSDEHKETFKGAPPGLQKFLLDRHKSMESDYTRKTTEIAERSKQYDRYAAIDKVFEPFRPRLQASGIDEIAAVQRLLNAQQMLDTDPKTALTHLAKQYGVDFGADAGSNQFADPDFLKVSQELAQVRQTLSQFQQQQQQSRVAELQGQIDAFKSDKDETGNPKHPHFDKLRAEIAGLLQAGAAKDLGDAYERAAWANPEVRADILKRQQDETEAKAKAVAAEKARDAAGRFLPNGKGIARPEAKEKESLRQELDRRLKEAGMH